MRETNLMWRSSWRDSCMCGAGILASVVGFLTFVPKAAAQG